MHFSHQQPSENTTTTKRSPAIAIAVVCSFIFHLLIIFGMGVLSYFSPSPDHANNVIEVAFVETEDAHKKAIDETKTIVDSDAQMANEQLSENAKFLSAKNNTVEKETRAETGAEFKNTQQMSATKTTSPQQNQQTQEKPASEKKRSRSADIFATDYDAYSALAKTTHEADHKKHQRDLTQQKQNQGSVAHSNEGSTTNDNLKDIQSDFMTRLNTREYKYFGYYSRIKTQLNQWWVPQVQQRFGKMVRQGRTIASEESKVTKLIIVLNDVGNLVKVQVLAESGVRDLDEAAIEAFRQAAPFPNPPKGMVESDGTVKIRWDCVVES